MLFTHENEPQIYKLFTMALGEAIKSPDSEYQFLDFLPFLERTANGDVVFTLKMGGPI